MSIHCTNLQTLALFPSFHFALLLNISSYTLPELRVVKLSGEIIAANCNCRAGLGGVCSHVCAILYTLELWALRKKSQSCTSTDCRWLPPAMENVQLKQIRDCDFASAKRKFDELAGVRQPRQLKPSRAEKRKAWEATDEECISLLTKINDTEKDCAVLRVVREFHERYATNKEKQASDLPPCMNFKNSDCNDMSYEELSVYCEAIFATLAMSRAQDDASSTIGRASHGLQRHPPPTCEATSRRCSTHPRNFDGILRRVGRHATGLQQFPDRRIRRRQGRGRSAGHSRISKGG